MNKALLLLPLILLSLLTGIWAGWLRLGWSLPATAAAAQHGALMVGSFLASLIFLERAVTFKSRWVLLLPAVNAASLLFFWFRAPVFGQWCLVVGSLGFVVMCSYFVYRYRELYYYVFLGGALALFTGNALLLQTFSYPHAVSWWMVFLLFTIVAERLELSRFLALTPAKRIWLIGALALMPVSLFIPRQWQGESLFSVALILTALWLLKYDMARRSVRLAGQHRYSALLLLTGYAWLLITAVLFVLKPYFIFYYDAVLHSFFIGFVFSMIFSHAPIILPAVLRWPIKIYRPVLYGWFGALQASLLLRIAGDVLEMQALRQWGGLLNGFAILLFFATILFTVQQQRRKRTTSGKA